MDSAEDIRPEEPAKSEAVIYQEVENYLRNGQYPEGVSKHEKAVIGKRSKNFRVVDGIGLFQIIRIHPHGGVLIVS